MTLSSPTILLKNRDPVLLVDCQVPRLKLLQFAQVYLGKEETGQPGQRKRSIRVRTVKLLAGSRFTFIEHSTFYQALHPSQKVQGSPRSLSGPTSTSSRLTSQMLAAIWASLAGGEKQKEYNFIVAENCEIWNQFCKNPLSINIKYTSSQLCEQRKANGVNFMFAKRMIWNHFVVTVSIWI